MKKEIKKRHKCHFCGAVRYEENMRKLARGETTVSWRFGNAEKCWACLNDCWRDKTL